MNARIQGEDENYVKIYATDNGGVEHELTVRKEDGEIPYHEQDGYPDDPSRRTPREDENVTQARRYARHHVYRERGYATLPSYENPDRLAAVSLAQGGLTAPEFGRYFGDLYRRVDADDHADLTPDSVGPENFRLYRQDVYIAEDPDTVAADVARWGRDVDEAVGGSGEALPLAEATSLVFRRGVAAAADGRDGAVDLAAVATVEAVSPVSVGYYPGPGDMATTPVDRPLDRDPDARLQFLPLTFDSLSEFRSFLAVHLRAQVRDCYLGMGVDPPEFYRVLGPGMWRFTKKWRHLDFYEPYHDVAADIPGYHYPMAPTPDGEA